MFGYIKAYKPNMLVKDYEAYRGVYCSLCKQLGDDYGKLSKFILSYDCTFYAMVDMSVNNICPKFKAGRCTFNPLKKCNYCKSDNIALKRASALSVITFYYKLNDDIKDKSFIKSIPVRLLRPYAKSLRKKAIVEFKEIDDIVKQMLENQFEVEKDLKCGVDKASEPTAVMLSEVMQLLTKDENQKFIYKHFGYYLGKWVYLIDAADDLESDIKKNGFNPYKNDKPISIEDVNKEEVKNKINSTLNYNVSKIIEAYNLMEFTFFSDVIDNIVTEGFANVQKQVLFSNNENRVELITDENLNENDD